MIASPSLVGKYQGNTRRWLETVSAPTPTGALMRQGAQQLLAANLGPERFREGALIRRARVPPGPEPPPDNAVCHSPNPGPRARGGLTIGKRWTERDRRRRLGRRYERSIDPAAAAAERVVVCTAAAGGGAARHQ